MLEEITPLVEHYIDACVPALSCPECTLCQYVGLSTSVALCTVHCALASLPQLSIEH